MYILHKKRDVFSNTNLQKDIDISSKILYTYNSG